MAVIRVCACRWFQRYRVFFVIGFMILCVQIYLAYKSLAINTNSPNNYNGLNNREYKKEGGSISSRKYKNHLIDDEDIQNNPNSVHNSKPKVEPKNYGNLRFNKTVLRLDELDFTPACDIVTKEAISAIHRAKTQSCKQYISNVTCLIQDNRFYAEQLPNSCPSDAFKANTPLGCYKDEKNFRLLSGYYVNYKTTNSPKNCIRMCLQSGFPYAGVQYTTECFCGISPPPSAAKLPDSSCNMKCSGDAREACGGYFTINIYETGIAKFSPQVAEITADPFEKPVRIAYLLTLNGRATRQVYRLIKALFHTDHYFYIHVDSRQDYLFRELLSLETKFENIKLARQRFSTIWGGASLLKMLLASMKELIEINWKWDFVINLSESDFPVKTNTKLVEFLTANKGRNFVKSHGREVQRFIQKQGLDKTFVECDTHMWRTGDRVLPWGIQIDGGSDWVSLSREFVTYVTNPDDLVKGLLIIFYHTLLPAESFFHTALRNSRFCNTYVDNNLHVTNWKRRLGCKCQYKHIVDWCGCSPNDFKIDDWPRLQLTENRQLFFARKFEPVINQEIILNVEEWLYGSYTYDVPNLHSYWQSVYHLADLSPPPDDALITVANSLIRIHSKTLQSEKCSVNVKTLLEVTSYFLNDKYKGLLLLNDGYIDGNDDIKMETWVKPQHYIQLQKTSQLVKRLKSIVVSSEYDQKEQISRNFGRTLGPYSELILVYEFLPGTETSNSFNVTVLWIDPAGNLADVSDVHIEDGHVFNFVKSNIKEPHLPGIWSVRIIHNKIVIIQNKFLVTPLQYLSGNEITQSQTDSIHMGSIHSYKNSFTATEWEVFLPSVSERAILENKSIANSKRTGLDLQEWIDSLTSKFYSSLGTCLVSKNSNIAMDILKCGKIKLDPCKATVWSSFAPDPKSFVSTINKNTQRLNRH